MDIFITVLLAAVGLVMGSFAGAQVWRMRARALAYAKEGNQEYNKHEYQTLKRLLGKKQTQDRSVCLQCGQQLAWTDLLPLVSWVAYRGKCRYCHEAIGRFEPVIEAVMAVLFAISFIAWPYGFVSPVAIALFVIWLVAIVLLVILAAYDSKWQLLPDSLNYSFMLLALVFAVMRGVLLTHGAGDAVNVLGSVGMIAGLYGALYAVSRGSWVGFGDVKLGVGLGLLLGDWRLAFLAVFLANFIGSLLVLPGVLSKKLTTKSRIAFGPLLIVGTLLAFWWGNQWLEWIFYGNVFIA